MKLVLISQGGGNFNELTDYYTIPNPSSLLGSYHQYAFSYDGSIAKMFIDGTLVYTSAANKAFSTNTAPLRIMAFDPSNAPYYWSVDGAVKGARLYGSALSSSQITGCTSVTKIHTG